MIHRSALLKLAMTTALGALALSMPCGCTRSESSSVPPATGPAVADNIPWRTNYEAALAEGKAAGKPILIDFSATWCPPCQEMKRSSWPDARVQKIASSNYIPLALDVDAEGSKEPAEKYHIDTIPNIVVVDSNGSVLRQNGFMSADELVAFLNQK